MIREGTASLPMGDQRFFDILMPYEIRLAQRRTLDRSIAPGESLPPIFTGLYLIQPIVRGAAAMPAEEDGGTEIRHNVETLIRGALRDSDILGRLERYRLLALVRDLEPQHAYVVAQRMLSVFNRSEVLRKTGVGIRIGYVIYPLASQANLAPSHWPRLVDLAARVGDRAPDASSGTGFGIMRGPSAITASIPETDLINLAFEDLDSLVSAGLLSLQRLHLIGNY